MAEINTVQIHFEYLIFCVFVFQLFCQLDLFQLANDGLFAGKLCIFNKLLADGGAALFKGMCAQIFKYGASDPAVVKPMMFIKVLVFCGDKSVFDVCGDIFRAYAFGSIFKTDFSDFWIQRIVNTGAVLRLFEFGCIEPFSGGNWEIENKSRSDGD